MKWSEYLAESLTNDGLDTDEDKEIIQFGLESLGADFLSIVLSIGIGIFFDHIMMAVLFWIWLFILRKNAGGFHATTKLGCLAISTGMLILTFVLFVGLNHTIIFYGVSGYCAGGVIWIMAPVDNPIKHIDMIEYKVYQRRCRVILGIDEIVLLIALYYKMDLIVKSVVMALFIVSISLLIELPKKLGRGQRREVK